MATGEAWPFEENELGSPALRVVMGESVGEESCYGEVFFLGYSKKKNTCLIMLDLIFRFAFFLGSLCIHIPHHPLVDITMENGHV